MKKIRFLLFADTHLGFDYPIKPRIDRRRRGPDFFANYRKVLSFGAEEGVDFVVHGGDLFFRSKVPRKVVDLSYRDLSEFLSKGMKIVLVPGNHERSKLPGTLLFSHPNLFLFDRPRTFELPIRGIRIALSGFPFVRQDIREGFPAVLHETGWSAVSADIRLLCMHQAVEGATVGPSNYTFRNGRDVVRMADIPSAFHAVLCGHIHREQVLEKPSTDRGPPVPVIYPGSVERTSFAEKEERKGFYDISLHPDGGEGWRIHAMDFQELPARPMRDILLDRAVGLEDLETRLLSEISRMEPDAVVRIKAQGPLDPEVRAALTAPYLRRLFPASMNVQLSGLLFAPREGGG